MFGYESQKKSAYNKTFKKITIQVTAGLNVDLGSFFELAELMVGMS